MAKKKRKKQPLAPVVGRWATGFTFSLLGMTALFSRQDWISDLLKEPFGEWYRGLFGAPALLIGLGIIAGYVILDGRTWAGIVLLFISLCTLAGLSSPSLDAGFFDLHFVTEPIFDRVPSFFLFIATLGLSAWLTFGVTHKHVASVVAPFFDWQRKPVPVLPARERKAAPEPKTNAADDYRKKEQEVLKARIAQLEKERKPEPTGKKIGIFGVFKDKAAEKPATPAPVSGKITINASLPAPAAGKTGQAGPAGVPGKVEIVPSRAVVAVGLPKAPAEKPKPKQLQFPHWEFPPMGLLKAPLAAHKIDPAEIERLSATIRLTLSQFGVDVEMAGEVEGPTVTQFRLKPADGIKLSRIENLKKDLTLSLRAKSIRIEAPIPGLGLVGVEVPNAHRDMIMLRDVLENPNFSKHKSPLALAVGKDISGNIVVGDLAKMPHLLIAGQTGSGKSVGVNGFLLSLLYRNTPADLRLILVDPKRVEMSVYGGIPHLLCPVINGADKALNALKWCVTEMIRRYDELTAAHTRNISEFNEKAEKGEKLPYIVVVIDELADFMMSGNKKEIENAINRIAQMGRAAGMHLMVATQRPSVDVITGLIKANIPSRIAFTVASQVDSRTILDTIGAEDLLGRGDMLYSAIGENLQRVQGVFVGTEEVEAAIHHIKRTTPPDIIDQLMDPEILEPKSGVLNADGSVTPDQKAGDDADEEALISQALNVIAEAGRASTSLLQRRMGLGYPRAARLMDVMRERGLVEK